MKFPVLKWHTAKFDKTNANSQIKTKLDWIFKFYGLAPLGINQLV